MEHIKRILIADDQKDWREKALKAANGYDVTVVSSAREVSDLIFHEERTFELLILDNNMEVQNAGADMLRAMRSGGNLTPVIIHSSDLSLRIKEQVRADGAVFSEKSYIGLGTLKKDIDRILG